MEHTKSPTIKFPKNEHTRDTFERPEQLCNMENWNINSDKQHILKINPDMWFEEFIDKTNCTIYEREITCRNLNLLRLASRFIGKQKLKLKRTRTTSSKFGSQDLFEVPDGANELEFPPVSWEVSDDHPLKSILTPGPPSNTCLSNNWYQRLNWTWRDGYSNLNMGFNVDYSRFVESDLALLKEIGMFYAAARASAVALLHCHPSFNSGVSKAYYEITSSSNPGLWSIYKPLFEDDRVFVFDSIVLTIILGNKRSGISREIAKRLYNNEFKSKKAFCDVLIQIGSKSLFSLPICAIVKYMGYSVYCEPLVPFVPKPKDILEDIIKLSTIPRNEISCLENKYDSTNSCLNVVNGKSKREVNILFDSLLTYNPELANQLNFVAEQLNIQGWPFPIETTDLYKYYGIKYNFKIWQHRTDGLYFVRHCGEMFPLYINENKEAQPIKRLREEFVLTYTHSSLPSTISIPLFLNSKRGDPTNDYKNIDLTKRENGVSRHSVLYNASQAMRLRLAMDLLPTINGLYVGFHDPWEITELLHNYGINICYGLGKLAQGKVIEPIRNTALKEIIARTIKRLWEEEIHVSFMDQTLVNEETIQIILIDFLNKILCNTDESNIYWNSKIIPSAVKRFQLNKLKVIISKTNIQLTPLFFSLQFHLGVHFNSKVLNSDSTLRLPLKIDDLCDFSEINVGSDFLFPQVKYIKYTLAHTQKLKRNSLKEQVLESKQGNSPILSLFGNHSNRNYFSSNQELDNLENQVETWNETGIIRGYYPKIKVIVPRTIKSVNICKTVLCQYIWRLRIPTWNRIFLSSSRRNEEKEQYINNDGQNESSTKNNDVNKTSENYYLFSPSSILYNPIYSNIVTTGNIGVLKANLEGYATPCHPKCKPLGKNYNREDKYIIDGKKEQALSNINCEWYYDCYKSLYYLLIVKRYVGENLERILFILLNIGYLELQHNKLQECLNICNVSILSTPETPKFRVFILSLKIQCLIRLNKLEEAMTEFNYMSTLLDKLFGNYRNCLILIKLQLCFSVLYYVNGDYNRCLMNSTQVEKILTPLLKEVSPDDSTHWIIMIALKFSALSTLKMGKYASTIVIGEKMLRSTIKSTKREIYLESVCRYIIGEATIGCGRYSDALKILLNCIPELDRYFGPSHKLTIKLLMMSTACKILLGCRDLMFPPLNLQNRETEIDNEYQYQVVYDLVCAEKQSSIIDKEIGIDNDVKSTLINDMSEYVNMNPYWTKLPITLIYDDILIMEKSTYDIVTAKYRDEALSMCKSLLNRLITNMNRPDENALNLRQTNKYSDEKQMWYNRILWVLKYEIVIAIFSIPQDEFIKLLMSFKSLAVSTSSSPFVKDLTFGKNILYDKKQSKTGKHNLNINKDIFLSMNNESIEKGNISQRMINKRIVDFTDYGYIDYCNINTNIYENISNKNIIESGIRANSNYLGASVIMSPRQMAHKSQEKEIYWGLITSQPTMTIVEICSDIYKKIIKKELYSGYEWCILLVKRILSGKSNTTEINIMLNLIRILLSKFHKKYIIALIYPETISTLNYKTMSENNLNDKFCEKTKYGLKAYQKIYNNFHNFKGSENHNGYICNNNGVHAENRNNTSKSKCKDLDLYLHNKSGPKVCNQKNNTYVNKIESNIDYNVLPQYSSEVAANLMLPMDYGIKAVDVNKDIRWRDPYRNYKYYDSENQTSSQYYIPRSLYEK